MKTKNNKTLGFIGVLGIWLTAGLALPFVNVLDMFEPQQLMAFRGFLTALMALVGLRGIVGKVDKYTYLIALTLPFATLGLFMGIRHLGAGPTIIIITATPIVSFTISLFTGSRVSRASVIGLLLVLGGVIMAHWGSRFKLEGLVWAIFGTVMNGILYEWFARALPVSQDEPLQERIRKNLLKSFWASIGMGFLGLTLSANTSWTDATDPKTAMLVLGFAFVGGFLYWISNMIAFENLPKNETSVLVQGETPAVILGAHFMLGESLTPLQWVGVVIALCGAWYLSRWLASK